MRIRQSFNDDYTDVHISGGHKVNSLNKVDNAIHTQRKIDSRGNRKMEKKNCNRIETNLFVIIS